MRISRPLNFNVLFSELEFIKILQKFEESIILVGGISLPNVND